MRHPCGIHAAPFGVRAWFPAPAFPTGSTVSSVHSPQVFFHFTPLSVSFVFGMVYLTFAKWVFNDWQGIDDFSTSYWLDRPNCEGWLAHTTGLQALCVEYTEGEGRYLESLRTALDLVTLANTILMVIAVFVFTIPSVEYMHFRHQVSMPVIGCP